MRKTTLFVRVGVKKDPEKGKTHLLPKRETQKKNLKSTTEVKDTSDRNSISRVYKKLKNEKQKKRY